MNLKSMTLPELTAVLKELGQPQFRAKQVYTWLHRGVRAYDEMTNLPKSLRDTLAREYPICAPKVVRRQESARDGTIKYLWELSDGNCADWCGGWNPMKCWTRCCSRRWTPACPFPTSC